VSQDVLLLHDNAHPPAAAHTTTTLQTLNWEVINHLFLICLDL